MRLSSKLPHGSVFLLPEPEDIFPAAAAALRGVESVSVVGSVVRSVDPRMDLFLFLLLKSDVLVRRTPRPPADATAPVDVEVEDIAIFP